MMKKKPEIKHFGDCSIYALNCFICDCGAFRRLMPDIDIVDMKTLEALANHQLQNIICLDENNRDYF